MTNLDVCSVYFAGYVCIFGILSEGNAGVPKNNTILVFYVVGTKPVIS
jgi:hypothetical protein